VVIQTFKISRRINIWLILVRNSFAFNIRQNRGKTCRFCINSGNLTGSNSGCLLVATAEEDFGLLHHLPDRWVAKAILQ